MSVDRHTFIPPTKEEIFSDEAPRSEIDLGMLQMQILWVLERKPSHGYELMKELSLLKKMSITQGTLYPTLQKLEKLGLIKGRDDDRKIVYSITGKGRATMTSACSEFTRTFFGIFHDFVCEKCVSRDLVSIKR